MIASEFFGYAASFQLASYLGVEDYADKANFLWSVIMLLLASSFIIFHQYFIAPIVCFISTEVNGVNLQGFITSQCWVEGLYSLSDMNDNIPRTDEEWHRREYHLNYYQWVPFILGIQAIVYYLPRLFWNKFTHNQIGVDLQEIIHLAYKASTETGEIKDKSVNHIVSTLVDLLYFDRKLEQEIKCDFIRKIQYCIPGKRCGNFVVLIYFLVKLGYVAIGYLQLHCIYILLRLDQMEGYQLFGYRILKDIAEGRTWSRTQIFPRVGFCMARLRNLGVNNFITAQCVLPVNMLIEKMYIFLFFYISFVLLLTILSTLLWLMRLIPQTRKYSFIKRCLKVKGVYTRNLDEKLKVRKFVRKFLRLDGYFLIRILSMNAGDLVTTEIVASLFDVYKTRYLDTDFGEPDFQPSMHANNPEFDLT